MTSVTQSTATAHDISPEKKRVYERQPQNPQPTTLENEISKRDNLKPYTLNPRQASESERRPKPLTLNPRQASESERQPKPLTLNPKPKRVSQRNALNP